MLILKQAELNSIIIEAEKYLSNAPKGSLHITVNKKSVQYYVKQKTKNVGKKYIPKKDKTFIQSLAQKGYAQKLLKSAKSEKCKIDSFLQHYQPKATMNIYEAMSSHRKELILPYILPEEEFAIQWQQNASESSAFPINGNCEITTEKGELVRSKSEKILADKLYLMHIPYHYEKPLNLKGFGTIHPDFTILNKRTRTELYWEHLGLMDNPDYCEKAIKKIETMQRNGIYIGEKLILAYETRQHPINMKIVEGLINKFLL